MAKNLRDFPESQITGMHISGDCIARSQDGIEILVDGRQTVPGEVVNITANRHKRKGKPNGLVTQVLQKADYRQDPLCPHFGVCGGCRWQLAPYSIQLEWKHDLLIRSLLTTLPQSFLDNSTIHQPLESPRTTAYRNKMEYSFSGKRWLTPDEMLDQDSQVHSTLPSETFDQPGDIDMRALGFFVPGTPNRVTDIIDCKLQEQWADKIRNRVRGYAKEKNLEFYQHRAHTGYLRTLVIRNTTRGEILVILITAYYDPEAESGIFDLLKAEFPEITSCFAITNDKMNDSYGDLPVRHQFGREWIAEDLEDLEFHIGPLSFFQTNLYQTPRLYSLVRDWAEISPTDLVYDLYTGTGTIAAYLARNAKKVIGIEYVEEAVVAARRSCLENGIQNAEFFAGDMKDLLTRDFSNSHGHPDVLVCDPPRAGMHPDVIRHIVELSPSRIVYVSCNPISLARDLVELTRVYTINQLQAVDMAPQTPHIETVVQLTLKKEF